MSLLHRMHALSRYSCDSALRAFVVIYNFNSYLSAAAIYLLPSSERESKQDTKLLYFQLWHHPSVKVNAIFLDMNFMKFKYEFCYLIVGHRFQLLETCENVTSSHYSLRKKFVLTVNLLIVQKL